MAFPNEGFPFEVITEFPLIANDASLGPVLRKTRWPLRRRFFNIHADPATQAETDSLFTDHSTQKGSAGSLSYTPDVLGEASTTVRFSSDEIATSFTGGPAGHDLSFGLEELI